MCGIVGYIGKRDATPILMEGLHRLEYRGYDSAGIAVARTGELRLAKCKGRVRELERLLPSRFKGSPGIAHTRWATHGEPSDRNPGRIVAAIFEAVQPLHQDRGGVAFADIANDAAHFGYPQP